MRLLVLSDTHIPDHAKSLPAGLVPALRKADLILHAGDVTSPRLLDELSSYAPVHAARGNNDGDEVAAWGALEEVALQVEGIRVAMVHMSGPARGRERRLLRRFPQAGLIVFGHSHIPMNYAHQGVRLFNPGSPTWKRRQAFHTYGAVNVASGRIRSRIVELPP